MKWVDRPCRQAISNGGLLCSGNKGSCRRSFDALVCRESRSAMSSWPSLSNALKGSRLTGWPAPAPVRLTHSIVQVRSDGDLLCFHNKGSRQRSFDASSQNVAFGEYSSLSGSDHTKPARSQVRGEEVTYTILTRSREHTTCGVRVGGPSAGSSGSNP